VAENNLRLNLFYRKLQKQHVHLSEWLEQETKKGQEVETEVIKKERRIIIITRYDYNLKIMKSQVSQTGH
jgi:division protein CdvB (Snf7/Vps24/ESCRT-III family)